MLASKPSLNQFLELVRAADDIDLFDALEVLSRDVVVSFSAAAKLLSVKNVDIDGVLEPNARGAIGLC